MKTPSSNLFDLIKSLDKNEKRYFRLYAAKEFKNENTLYLKLFDAVEKQCNSRSVYDESEIKKALAGTTLSKQLAFYKNYLYNHLLQCLRLYFSSQSTDAFLKNKMQELTILYNRGLFKQCKELITEVKKVALKHEKYLVVLEANEWEGLVASSQVDIKALHNFVTKEHDDAKALTESYSLQTEMFARLQNVYTLIYSDGGKKVADSIDISELDQFLEAKKTVKQTMFSQVFYQQIKAAYYFFTNQLEKDFEIRKKLFELFLKNKHIAIEYPHYTFFSFYNYALSGFRIGKYEQAYKIIDLLRNDTEHIFVKKSKYLEANIFITTYGLEMQMIVATEKYDGNEELEQKIKEGLTKYAGLLNISNTMAVYGRMAQIMFGNKKYKESLIWINKIINEPDDQIRIDLRSSARILNILAHYELKNFDYLSSLYRNTLRFLKKNDKLYHVEKLILNFIVKDLIICHTEAQKNASLIKFKKELMDVMSKSPKGENFKHNSIVSWIDRKLKKH